MQGSLQKGAQVVGFMVREITDINAADQSVEGPNSIMLAEAYENQRNFSISVFVVTEDSPKYISVDYFKPNHENFLGRSYHIAIKSIYGIKGEPGRQGTRGSRGERGPAGPVGPAQALSWNAEGGQLVQENGPTIVIDEIRSAELKPALELSGVTAPVNGEHADDLQRSALHVSSGTSSLSSAGTYPTVTIDNTFVQDDVQGTGLDIRGSAFRANGVKYFFPVVQLPDTDEEITAETEAQFTDKILAVRSVKWDRDPATGRMVPNLYLELREGSRI